MHIPKGTTTTTATVTAASAQLPATMPLEGEFGAVGEAPQASSHRLDYTLPFPEQNSTHDYGARTISRMALPSPTSVGPTSDAQFMDSRSTVVLGNPSENLGERTAGEATARPGTIRIMSDADVASTSVETLMAQSTDTQSFETRLRDGSTLATVEALPTMSTVLPRFKQGSDPLPDMPVWVLGILAGLLSFAFVAAIILFLVNFPYSLDFLEKLRRHRVVIIPAGSQPHHDREQDRELNGSNTAAFATSTSSGAARKRKARHLSVDTSAQYRGLGIAVPGSGNLPLSASRSSLSRRRSYDEEALQLPTTSVRGGHRSAAAAAWHAVTAPLPAISAFSPGPLPHHPPSSDLEIGTYHYHRLTRAHSEEMSSSGLYDTAAELEDIQQQHVSWMGRLGDRMEVAAQKLARLMHDQVQEGREGEGLLLPIRKNQRERIVMRGSGASAV